MNVGYLMGSVMANSLKIAFLALFCLISIKEAHSETLQNYLQRLSEHPQVQSILAESSAASAQAKGERGLPNPILMFGVDNVPVSDPAFDRFLPTSKVIGFSQKIPNPFMRGAKSRKYEQLSEKQRLIARYTEARLEYMLLSKLAEYESVKRQQHLIEHQLDLYKELENTLHGQIQAGRAVYQRFSEIDVERAEAEKMLNDLNAKRSDIEAEFVRLIDEVPDIEVPEIDAVEWENAPDHLYPVSIAEQDIELANKDVSIAGTAFLPDFGVNAVYKQRESGRNGTFSGEDWFSVQAQISIPLWAPGNQMPKLTAAKERKRSAQLAYDDIRRTWMQQMTSIRNAREAAAANIKVLNEKERAMSGKIKASERNYEAGTDDLDRVLFAKIDRLNIQAQIAKVKAMHIARMAEYNSNIITDIPETDE